MKIKKGALFFLLMLVIFAVMSPIASQDWVPADGDHLYHLANILNARQALSDTHSLFLRVAPFPMYGWLYPVFQFYSPSVYMLGGAFATVLSHNPLDPFKFSIGLMALLGGGYCYRLYSFLFGEELLAVIGAVFYLISPYFLMNINVRGDFAEAVSQAFLPVTLYYALRLFYEEGSVWKKARLGWLASGCFYLQITGHLITCLTFTGFLFLLLGSLTVQRRNLRSLLWVGGAFCGGAFLAMWYVEPILMLHALLRISRHSLSTPWDTNWMTHLSTLLSPKGISASPITTSLKFPFYVGVGLPMSITLGYWGYRFFFAKDLAVLTPSDRAFVKPVFYLFLLAFFLIWSPFNFWKFLPHLTYVIQFSYRILTDLMWLGGILFVLALKESLKRKVTPPVFVALFFGLMLSAAAWMSGNYQALPGNEQPTPIKMVQGQYHYFSTDYLVDPPAVPRAFPAASTFSPNVHCESTKLVLHCDVIGPQSGQAVLLPLLYYPTLLHISADGKTLPYAPQVFLKDGRQFLLTRVNLPAGAHTIRAEFTGNPLANWVSRISWILYGLMGLVLMSRWRKGNNKRDQSLGRD